MEAIILAAGTGERLLPLTKDRPKILVDLGDGTTLLQRHMSRLSSHPEIDKVIIGGGYCVERLEEFRSAYEGNGKIDIVYNPFYGISGPLVTLWVVLNVIDESNFMIMNGDTLYGDMVYTAVSNLSARTGVFLVCSKVSSYSSDDVKLRINDHNMIVAAGKDIDAPEGISSGLLVCIGDEAAKSIKTVLNDVSRREGFLDRHMTWHSLIGDMSKVGIDINPVFVDKVNWAEIDIHYDFTELRNLLKMRMSTIDGTKD